MPEDHFGPEVAASYDSSVAGRSDPAAVEPVVDVLAELAGDGRALEFAIGTGRIALPLAARGVEVCGIELSEAMVEQLRRKPGGRAVEVATGDMSSTRVAGAFRLVYLVFNTIGNLTTQEQQIACFANAAAHLEPGGSFVVEVGVPELRRLPPGERHVVFDADGGHFGIDEYDTASQRLISHHLRWADEEVGYRSLPFRYVWPAELDLMARLAGMTPASRWADWRRRPFDHESTAHVSVWRKPAIEQESRSQASVAGLV
ncbi:MAG: class I SAM-dependent methyltransferase [Acidobacteriota bacterium]|nr:class I SAM-dependent methyltransferase [Acidobacteriota bacterium]